MTDTTNHYRTDGMVARAAETFGRELARATSPVPVPELPAQPQDTFHATTDGTSHSETTLKDGRISYSSQETDTSSVEGSWRESEDQRVRALIADAISDREKRENIRANKRNFNRMLMLLGALLIGLAVTWVLTNGWLGSWGPVLAPYAFVITILMDSTLSVYAYVKHY